MEVRHEENLHSLARLQVILQQGSRGFSQGKISLILGGKGASQVWKAQ